MKYVRRNMWPSMRFTDDDADLNRQGLEWSGVVANARVHGTTYRIPWEMLDEERAYFGKLPDRADADTAGRMDRVVEVVRSSHPGECGSGWRPVVVDPGPWGTCFGAPGERGSLVGGVPAPPGLMEGRSARWASGRDSSNNVIVYWSEDSLERPSGGAGCWLFDSSSRSWSANRGLGGSVLLFPAPSGRVGAPGVRTVAGPSSRGHSHSQTAWAARLRSSGLRSMPPRASSRSASSMLFPLLGWMFPVSSLSCPVLSISTA